MRSSRKRRGMKARQRIVTSIVCASTMGFTSVAGSAFLVTAPLALADAGQMATTAAPIITASSAANYGVYTFFWDGTMHIPGINDTMQNLGFGYQEYYGEPGWSNAFTFDQWGQELQATHQNGLFTFDWEDGLGAAQAKADIQYALAHGYPIRAVDIGTEDYGMWRNIYQQSRTPAYYAQSVTAIAQAIKSVDPTIQVGIDYDGSASAWSYRWDQQALRAAMPYIDFVSVHDYPFGTPPTDAQLLQQMPSQILDMVGRVQEEIQSAAQPGEKLPAIWMTEFSPVNGPYVQSIEPVYGAALVEAELTMQAAGVQKIFNWGLTGGSSNLQGQSVSQAGQAYGTFGLISTGNAPQPAALTEFPSAQALSGLIQDTGSRGTLRTWIGQNSVIGEVYNPDTGLNSAYFVNESSASTTFTYESSAGQQTLTVAPTALSVVHNAPLISGIDGLTPLTMPQSLQGYTPLPTITGVQANPSQGTTSVAQFSDAAYGGTLSDTATIVYPGETVTVTGSNFGATQGNGYVYLYQGPLDTKSTYPASTSWGEPQDSYKVPVISWSDQQVTFQVPAGAQAPTSSLLYGGVVTDARTTNAQLFSLWSAQAPAPVVSSVSATSVYNGEQITIHGANFGSAQGAGFLRLVQQQSGNTVSWGAPGNMYQVPIESWSDQQITVDIPNRQGGNSANVPLQVGAATSLSVTNAYGATSGASPLTVVNPPAGTLASVSADHVYAGETLTLQGSGFGSSQGQGYVWISQDQGAVNWGAPGNWYKVPITSWSDNQVVIQLPDNQAGGMYPPLTPGVPTTVAVANDLGGLSSSLSLTITNRPQISALTSTSVYNGEQITIQGSGFGAQQASGYVTMRQTSQGNTVNWGAPGNWYRIPIVSWSDSSITIDIPNHQTGASDWNIPLQVGVDTDLSVVNAYGQSTVASPITVTSPPAPVIASVPGSVYGGQSVTITGTGFGTVQGAGYVWLKQSTTGGDVNWGAPGNWYRIPITSWNDGTITFSMPDHQTGASDSYIPLTPVINTQVYVANALGGVSSPMTLTVVPVPGPSLNGVVGAVYGGALITLQGSGFGTVQGNGYVWVQQTETDGSFLNWGAPGNWYRLPIYSWSDTAITLQIPGAQSGWPYVPLNPDLPTAVAVGNTQGGVSTMIPISWSAPPTYAVTASVYQSVYEPDGTISPGDIVTLTAPDFGTQSGGYVQIQEGGQSWGAPGNWWGIDILRWVGNEIQFILPDGKSNVGSSLWNGDAVITVHSANGSVSSPILFHLTGY